ncbi:MAG TPA: phosphohydrolase [Verrucomicrobiae bacterium]|nr:phosphohydrolase [Verrucomicrobiae bacterium]
MDGTVAFTRMDQGTREEYEMLEELYQPLFGRLPDNVLGCLKLLGGDKMGYKIDRLHHSLQTATRAFRDNADEETVVVALLHDIGDNLAPENHGEFASAVLRPYISEANYWLIKQHPVFQGYYYYHHVGRDRDERERFRGHPHFEKTAHFCEKWDQMSFDPDYDTMPLSDFEPMVHRLFAKKPFTYGN